MSKGRILEVLDYDPAWVAWYMREADALREALSPAFVRAHHIGSTSVPGLSAKPTIDIAVEVRAGTAIPRFYGNMEALGFICRGECLDAAVPGVPGRHYFVRRDGVKHLVHVHAYETGHDDLEDKLLLRNYLRADQEAASGYAALKRSLVKVHADDNLAYMRGKDSQVKVLLAAARRWAREESDG